jgi:secreted trypsin-like serine protease
MFTPDRTGAVRPRRRAVAAAVAFLLLVILAAAAPARAIVNGKPVTPSDAYAQAVVGVVPLDKYNRGGYCSGILLTPHAVLTAAHCLTGADNGVNVVFDLEIGDANKVAVTRTVIHPDFTDDVEEDQFSPGDIAVIFLADHDNPTVIIPFDPDLTFTDGQQFVVLGYGRSIPNRSRSAGILRKAAIAATGYDTPREIAMKPLMDAWPCGGDSGGPILRKDMSGRYALSGIMNGVSAGPVGECTFRNSFITPVHSYADWIKTTLAAGK